MTSLRKIVRDDASAAFFDAAASGTLAVRRCANGHYLPPTQGFGGPAVRCQVCQSPDITWQPASGSATLVSWVVPYGRGGEATNIAGIVELAEGPWMNALIDVAPDAELHAGQALTVCFLPTDGGETVPAFRPA
jgi:uncharacterized OB-fold protein